MGKRDLLSVHRGPGLAHWPASLSLSTKEYRRGHFLLRSVTSLIRLRARRDTSRRQTRLRGHFFLLLSPRGFERTCAYFSAMTARAVLVVAARREQTCPFLSALYVGNMSKRWEHVRRICTIRGALFPARDTSACDSRTELTRTNSLGRFARDVAFLRVIVQWGSSALYEMSRRRYDSRVFAKWWG